MLFSSIPFLFYFFPIVLILYFACPKKGRNFVLFLVSLVFYAWGEPKYCILMAASILAGYIFGLLIERCKAKKALLAMAIVLNVAVFAYFKYSDFFIENFNAVTGLSLPLLKIALPIGISFYTFQILSYIIDVYRGEKAQRNIIDLGAYITMFPQLVAGPIVRYSDVAVQLKERSYSMEKAALGARRLIIGIGKKVLLANTLGQLCDAFLASGEQSVLFYWLYAVAFMLQIYFDFSGYSDMAIGLGRILGFEFMENFRHPYVSRSITEFWRRWHISLGFWFRDYVYIPMGGNRKGKVRWLFNILVVWLLTGFWHGTEWNFMVWGVYFGVILLIEKLWLLKKLEKAKVINHFYVFFLCAVSFVMFNAGSMGEAMAHVGGLFGLGGQSLVSKEALYYLSSYAPLIIIGIIGATPLPAKLVSMARETKAGEKVLNILEPIALVLIFITATAFLVDGSFNPFLYFRF